MGDKSRAIEHFSEEYRKLGRTDQTTFSKLVNVLLNRTFVLKGYGSDKDDYYFICDHKELFSSYFDLIDYEVVHNIPNSFIYIKTTMDRSRLRLTKFDTALILVLRLLYHTRSKQVTSHDKIEVTVADIVEKFRSGKFFGDDRKISHFDQSLRMLRGRMIVAFKCTKFDESVEIQILPTILAVVPADDIENLIKRLEGMKTAKADDDDEIEGEVEDEDLT